MKIKLCVAEGCGHVANNGRYCNTCNTKNWRNKHLLKYLYQNWKDNARRRGKVFTVTFDEFVEFCKDTNYDKLRGVTKLSLNIDRIRGWEGYTKDNIRAITMIENVMKEHGIDVDLDPAWQMEKEPCPF